VNASYTLLQTRHSELAATKERWHTNATTTQEKLRDAEIKIALLQTQNSDLTASRNGWRVAAVVMSVLLSVIVLLIIAGIITWKLGIFKNPRHSMYYEIIFPINSLMVYYTIRVEFMFRGIAL